MSVVEPTDDLAQACLEHLSSETSQIWEAELSRLRTRLRGSEPDVVVAAETAVRRVTERILLDPASNLRTRDPATFIAVVRRCWPTDSPLRSAETGLQQ